MCKLLLRGGADSIDETDGPFSQHLARFFLIQRCETAWFVQVRCDLGKKLVHRQSHRDGDAKVALDHGRKPRQDLGRDHAVDQFCAAEIKECLVDGKRFHQRRQGHHGLTDLAAHADVFRHVRPHHDGGWAKVERLEHRHGRAHAIGACDVTGR